MQDQFPWQVEITTNRSPYNSFVYSYKNISKQPEKTRF